VLRAAECLVPLTGRADNLPTCSACIHSHKANRLLLVVRAGAQHDDIHEPGERKSFKLFTTSQDDDGSGRNGRADEFRRFDELGPSSNASLRTMFTFVSGDQSR
jgi:hypothetical protein